MGRHGGHQKPSPPPDVNNPPGQYPPQGSYLPQGQYGASYGGYQQGPGPQDASAPPPQRKTRHRVHHVLIISGAVIIAVILLVAVVTAVSGKNKPAATPTAQSYPNTPSLLAAMAVHGALCTAASFKSGGTVTGEVNPYAECTADPHNLELMTRTPDQVPQRPAEQRPAEQLRADARQNHGRLINAATQAFAEKGADAPLEDIARRAGVGIGTLYRHFPTRLDLQAAVFRSQVGTVCGEADALLETASPEQAFTAWVRSLNAYLVTKRGLSKALIEAVGVESELISSCWMTMRQTTERLLEKGQQAGIIRPDVDATDVMRLVHGVALSTERAPERADALLMVMLDGLKARPS